MKLRSVSLTSLVAAVDRFLLIVVSFNNLSFP